VRVTGQFLATGAYCGGKVPSPEQLENARRRKPVPHAKLLVRRGKTNANEAAVAELETDAEGRFDVILRPGTYCIVRDQKRNALPPRRPQSNVDSQCYANWLRSCDAIWEIATVPVLKNDVVVNNPCFGPCYRGPMPP
jgi:hypothetical protein